MKYPELSITPIKEIIFSISYKEIVDEDCFKKFLELEIIKNKFNVIPAIDRRLNIEGDKLDVSSKPNGFHLKNKDHILQLRTGSFSFHYLNGYEVFDNLLDAFINYWKGFDNVTKDILSVTDFSIRYINVIETDEINEASHLVQLYPRQSSDREIKNFQNSIQFNYVDSPKYIVNAVSTKLKEKGVLLDISVKGKNQNTEVKNINLKNTFKPLQEIKNKAFFDSITARALIKYIKKH